jgi:5,10-methylenetetrahydromethanopterin reductase
MEMGLLILGEHPPVTLIELAQLVESYAYDVFWYADEKFYRDVYVGLTMVAMHTHCLRPGPCVTDPYARHPALTAAAMGLTRTRPAVAIREAVDIIRGLWRGETVHYHGGAISCDRAQLNFVVQRPLPIVIGTRGHHTLKMAGAIAEGVMIAPYASRPGLEYAMGRIREGTKDRRVQIIARVEDIAAPGMDQITMYPIVLPGHTLSEAIRCFAQDIMPHVRA